MMTKKETMATAKCCQSERGLSNMIFAFAFAKEESMWCKREELKQLINFVFVKF